MDTDDGTGSQDLNRGSQDLQTDQDPGPWTGKPENGQGLDQRSLPEGGLLYLVTSHLSPVTGNAFGIATPPPTAHRNQASVARQ